MSGLLNMLQNADIDNFKLQVSIDILGLFVILDHGGSVPKVCRNRAAIIPIINKFGIASNTPTAQPRHAFCAQNRMDCPDFAFKYLLILLIHVLS